MLFPFWIDKVVDFIQVPISCFMQTPKSKRIYKMGKVGVKIETYQALKLLECRYFLSLKYGLGFSKENAVYYCLNAVKALFAVQFLNTP